MRLVLELPEPPSRRAEDKLHWAVKRRLIFDTKKDTWRAAIDQHIPFADAPRHVRVSAHFRLHNPVDPDNLYGMLKRVLDALKQNHTAHDSLEWRYAPDINANWITRGFIWDDNADSVALASITQAVDRKNRGVTVTLEWDEDVREAA